MKAKRLLFICLPLVFIGVLFFALPSCKKAVLPTINTLLVTDITYTTAISGGEILNDGGADVTERGICWSPMGIPTISDYKTSNGLGIGSFASELTNLTPMTAYQVRAYAINEVGVAYGNVMTFMTPIVDVPVLSTTALSGITNNTAISGGNITSDGGNAVSARGVVWSTIENPELPTKSGNVEKNTSFSKIKTNTNELTDIYIPFKKSDYKLDESGFTTDGTGSGPFTSNITGLTAGTTYYVRAYATNSAGTSYGNQISFAATSVKPTLTTTAATSITETTATSGGDITSEGGSAVTVRGVCWSTTQNPIATGSHTTDGAGTGSFTSSITGLTCGTTYYVRAYATNSAGTTYGTQISFTTTTVLPTVTTTALTLITTTTASSGGNVTTECGANITARGICWSTSQNPLVTDSHTSNGTGTGIFTSSLSGLSPSTTYYVRAYATNSGGTAYGDQLSFTTSITTIGSTYAGGIVFYIDGTGQHGLVCAPTNQSTAAIWGCQSTDIAGTSTEINTGATNTNLIVAGCPVAGIAARLCYDLTLNTYSDWFLPSKDELNLMYVNLKTQGLGNFANDFYWSSSQKSAFDQAWAQSFSTGLQGYYTKFDDTYVRAVRAF